MVRVEQVQGREMEIEMRANREATLYRALRSGVGNEEGRPAGEGLPTLERGVT